MSGWVKWEKDLESDPRTRRMTKELRRMSNAPALPESAVVTLVCGGLLRLWSYADSHIRSDDTLDMGAAEVDEYLGVENFCSVMPEDWLIEVDEHTVKLPDYQVHNGVEAKKTALTQKRVARHRQRERNAPALPDQTRPEETRPDQKEREARAREVDVPRGKPNGTDGVIHVGDNLTKTAEEIWNDSLNSWREDNPSINAEKFSEWLADLQRRGKPLQPNARCLQARWLAQQGTAADQAEIVDHCMANEYRRLIPLSDIRGKAGGKDPKKRWQPSDIEPAQTGGTRLV